MVKKFFNDIYSYRYYCAYVAKSEIRAEVISSYLDWLWWIFDPILTMTVYVIVFGYIFKGSEPDFPAFVFIGVLIWNFISNSINSSIKIVKANKMIITKVYIPKFVLIVSMMYKNIYKLMFGLVVEAFLMLSYRIVFSAYIFAAFLCFISMCIFTFGICTLFLHLGVIVDDLSHIVSTALKFLMYFSGVMYSIEKRFPTEISYLAVRINPFAFYIANIRNAMLYGKSPDYKLLLVWTIVAIALSCIGIKTIYNYENGYAKAI